MASQSPTAPSDCPTPLAWQQVLEAFDEQSTSWELDSQRGPIAGRSIGSGPALVFLNPLLGNWRLMALSAWLLRDQFHCVLFDDSSLLARRPRIAPGSVDDLVEDLWSVHEELGLQQLILLGTGLGSGVGLAALGEHDGRIAAAVLQGPLLQTHLTSAEDWLAVLGSHLPGRLRHVPGFRSLMVHNHKPWFPPYDETRLAFAIEVTGAVPLRTAARRARRLDRLDLGGCLEQLAQSRSVPPLLLIVPESLYDPSQPSHSPATAEITARLPAVRVEALAGCGPLGCLTHPHRLTKLVRSFLDEILSVRLPSLSASGD
jgi:pimeloyl-ACP methyl ester carboxylesterase